MSVHPALLNRFKQQISTADEDDLNGLEGWDSFEPDEKKFLAVFGWFGIVKSRLRLGGTLSLRVYAQARFD